MDGASLALFRIAFWLIIAWDVVRFFKYDRIQRYYIEPRVYFGYLPFIEPWGGQGMVWHFAALGVLSLLCAAGLFYRVAAPLACAAFTYIFLLDKAQYLNHMYLCCLLGLLLAVAPVHRAFSLDRLLALRRVGREGRAPPVDGVPRWSLLVLRYQISIVYFYGGIAKINADWLAGRPLDQWLAERTHLPWLGPWLGHPAAPLFMAYAGLLIDLSVPFLLWWRRGRPFALVICILFHASNKFLFNIGIFPFVMVASLALYPDPSWPRRLLRWLLRRPAPASSAPAGEGGGVGGIGRRTRLGLLLLHGYVLVQLLLPLRHWLYPGDVAWNEAGHRFSWRMKLRDKEVGELAVHVINPRTGFRKEIDLEDWLTPRQIDEMATRPDMLVDFAHIVAEHWKARFGVRPMVTARVTASLNGSPDRELLDPTLDLAAQPRGVLGPW